ncbi:helix-turn-helix domain-containing protein [Clostridium thermobutyricum]|uniref:helix-turn-helix domain-containing protein n=1 Tax=Clostridium thermobutyricum TaxID=29372 RepID=UPI003F52506C
MTFKEKLKDFRMKQAMTQVEFSKAYKLPRTTISELESGRKEPTLKMIGKIAKATNTKTSYWIDKDLDLNHSKFDALDLIIPKLIDNGMIDKDGNLNEKAKEIILQIVEAEIKLSYLK